MFFSVYIPPAISIHLIIPCSYLIVGIVATTKSMALSLPILHRQPSIVSSKNINPHQHLFSYCLSTNSSWHSLHSLLSPATTAKGVYFLASLPPVAIFPQPVSTSLVSCQQTVIKSSFCLFIPWFPFCLHICLPIAGYDLLTKYCFLSTCLNSFYCCRYGFFLPTISPSISLLVFSPQSTYCHWLTFLSLFQSSSILT